MKLESLVQGLNVRLTGGAGVVLTDITDDSRTAARGGLFIARPGTKADGRRYILDAVTRGAAAIISEDEKPADLPAELGWVVAPGLNNALVGELAERFFDRPSQKLKLIGVTGTNGKTTITFVIQHFLRHTGVKAGIIGTVYIDDGDTRKPAELTTPGAIDFSRHLAAMVKNGCEAAIAEVSSHALHQGRAAALRFDVGIFTNLTGDHLDYHETMENYAAAKAILFEGLSAEAWAVVNGDDAWTARMVRDTHARVVRCTMKGACADNADKQTDGSGCSAEVIALGADHSRVRFDGPWGSVEVRLPLVGRHNVMNVLEALAAANCVKSLSRVMREALETCPAPPGRLEPVRVEGDERSRSGSPAVLVDYAHTHDALENVLSSLRPVTKGKVIVMFGCGGDRDRTKRPKMARVACALADVVVVTSDNPRTEEPAFIIGQIMEGVPAESRGKVTVEPDRARAINLAVRMGGPDDVVLLAGKGHEDYQIIGTTKRHFDDREEARRVLEARMNSARTPAGAA
ncbi:MAG: UDP-N-acetylmuramoyl-L-alanyl-D-glutamate--2,6-diaminopimelate ligase [Planctomycetes bacterium]|nr:UDP-N-acetylmuramoyl-L-alanyl-D-glutamate--2,6-diaminopimelate ligase [Planctomycetota bacterium]